MILKFKDIDNINDIDDLVEAFDGGDMTIRAELTVKSSKVTRIDGYVSQLEGDLDYMTVSNESRPRGEMGVSVDGLNQIRFKFDEDTRIAIDGTDYDAENINSLKNLVNRNDISGVTVRFDEDGLATSVKD